MFDIRHFIKRVYNKVYTPIYKKKMLHCGSNVYFSPVDSVFTYESMSVGDNVSIGYHADFVATRSKIIIGDHVVFGPHVSIRGGNHRFVIPGIYRFQSMIMISCHRMMLVILEGIIGLG